MGPGPLPWSLPLPTTFLVPCSMICKSGHLTWKHPPSPPFMGALSPEPLPGSTGLAFLPFIRLPEGWAACLLFTQRYQGSWQSWGALEMALAVSRMSMRDLAQRIVRFYDLESSLVVKKEKLLAWAQLPAPYSSLWACVCGLECLESRAVALGRHLFPGWVQRPRGSGFFIFRLESKRERV